MTGTKTSASAVKDTTNYPPVAIKAFANCDDVYVVWQYAAEIDNCIGFELQRQYTEGPRKGTIEVVNNRINFSGPAEAPLGAVSSASSPFRRFSWTDYTLPDGTTVKYKATPILINGKGTATDWSNEVTVQASAGKGFSCYFNRGLLMSQFMSRYFQSEHLTAAQLKKDFQANSTDEIAIKSFLGGPVREQMLEMLKDIKNNNGQIYAALYELSDPELMNGLKALSGRAHIVLSNGSHNSKTPDENAASRKELEDAGVDVHDRMLKTGLAHNKFAVICDSKGKPISTWTGSTNWTSTGLCTQMNNALKIDDPQVAKIFLDHWEELKDSGSANPKSMIQKNDTPQNETIGKTAVQVWFTRTSDFQEMDAVNALVEKAQQGILFLMFQPGKSTMLDSIIAQQAKDQNLYVHGVISTMNKDETDTAHVSLITRNNFAVKNLDVVQPQGIAAAVSHWQKEVTRNQFLSQVGYAIVHSKVIVIDPFGSDPIVITGSHNFSASASSKNDENLLIIRGNAALAQAYAVHIKGVYDHYRWNAFVTQEELGQKDPASVMNDRLAWQDGYFTGDDKKELDFWMNRGLPGN